MAYTPMQLVVGAIMDLYGPRYILTFAIVVCTLGNLIFGTTHSVWLAGIGRFLIGFGSAFAFVGALKLAAIWLPLNRFATFAGIVGGVAMIGAMIGDMGLTSLVQHIGWQETVFIGTIVGVVLIPLIWLIIRDDHFGNVQRKPKFHEVFVGFPIVVRNSQISEWFDCLFTLFGIISICKCGAFHFA
jgi:MFS family permease